MTKPKPIPGFYRYKPQQAPHLPGFVQSDKGQFIAECSDANGPLLAAAPKLLAMLKRVARYAPAMELNEPLAEKVLALIEEVEGGT